MLKNLHDDRGLRVEKVWGLEAEVHVVVARVVPTKKGAVERAEDRKVPDVRERGPRGGDLSVRQRNKCAELFGACDFDPGGSQSRRSSQEFFFDRRNQRVMCHEQCSQACFRIRLSGPDGVLYQTSAVGRLESFPR